MKTGLKPLFERASSDHGVGVVRLACVSVETVL